MVSPGQSAVADEGGGYADEGDLAKMLSWFIQHFPTSAQWYRV
ncbi:hypothetical protein [Streptomyces sp. NPDC096032]